MAKWIKNTTVGDKTWVGQLVSAGTYYQIQSQEEALWANNSVLLTDIASGDALVAKDDSGNNNITDVTSAINYLKDIQVTDVDGRILQRPVAAKSGWTYFMCPIEFKTSDLDSVYAKKHDNTDRTTITYKIYDVNDAEITDSANEGNAVKTVLDFEAPHDYEIIGGDISQISTPASDIRLWVVAVPDIPEGSGGSKEMCGGVNFKFLPSFGKIRADGRVSKYMTYNATYHTNKLRLILRHSAGIQHDIMMVLETFKA